jgi:spore germination protein YaaH
MVLQTTMTVINKVLVGILCLLFVIFTAFVLYPPKTPFSPFKELLSSAGKDTNEKREYVILGFLPYWNIKKVSPQALSYSNRLAFFSLRLDGSGQVMTHVTKREEEPGFTNYKRWLKNPPADNDKTMLTIVQKDQDSLNSLLNSATARKNAIRTISSLLNESHFTGVNIDFEPLGDISAATRNNFTQFMKDLHSSLCPHPGSANCKQITISMYASAASTARLWDLKALPSVTDYFVVMTYDYTMPGNDKSGPNSPLRGAGTLFEHDVITNLAQISQYIPANQILLGIPFYGYEWDTSDTVKYAPAASRGSLASLERIQQLIDENTLELLWDRNSLTPYAVRREDGKVVSQIYFEDINSIKLKLDLVKQAGYGGIAIWALGYEGNNPSLWDTITTMLRNP